MLPIFLRRETFITSSTLYKDIILSTILPDSELSQFPKRLYTTSGAFFPK